MAEVVAKIMEALVDALDGKAKIVSMEATVDSSVSTMVSMEVMATKIVMYDT